MAPISEARRLANARNAQHSTGPRTEEGKKRSSMNALKHGLTAAQAVMSNEDPAAYQARLDRWVAFDRPTDPAHEAAIECCVSSLHRRERCILVENARAEVRVRRAGDQHDFEKFTEAEEIGGRLIHDPVNRCDVAQLHDPVFRAKVQKRLDDNPAILTRQLQMTSQGVDWLIQRWNELGEMLRRNKFWHYPEKFRAVWLLGRNPHDVLEDKLVQKIFLACNVAHPEISDTDPEFMNLWDECHQARIGLSGKPMYIVQVETLKSFRPPDALTARSVLLEIVEMELTRLRELKKRLGPIDKLDRESAQERAMFDDSKEGVLLRRYETACEREFHRALSDLLKLRKEAAKRPEPVAEAPPVRNEATPEISPVEMVTSLDPFLAQYEAAMGGQIPGRDSVVTPNAPVSAPAGPVPDSV